MGCKVKNIRDKHVLVGILESTAGSVITIACFYKSWRIGVLAGILVAVAIVQDMINIEEEEDELSKVR